MDEKILEKLKEMENWTISSQGLEKDNWIIKKGFQKKDDKKRKYIIIQCKFCGKQKLVGYYNFIRDDRKALACECNGERIEKAKAAIGKTIGHYKILDFCEIKKGKNKSYQYYFDVECVNCGSKHYHVLYNKNAWVDYYEGCPNCPRTKMSFSERRYKEYIQGAKVRNINWDLTLEQFEELTSKNCIYCGSKPDLHIRNIGKNTVDGYMNGIDRIDSNKGYNINNCVPCCKICNIMKSDLSKDIFLEHVSKIYHFNQGSTTISKESTSQANGGGNREYPNKDNDIV